ncbi:MAG: DUF5685 family protein [Intestinibacillus sp.]
MFGFIRPVKSELRVREMERFQSVYCGLCHAIRRRYGRVHTLSLSYDMTFLTLLLEGLLPKGAAEARQRCDASPVRAKCVLCEDEAIGFAADVSVLLTYHKLQDTVADDRGAKRLAALGLRQFSERGYHKARAAQPELDRVMADCLQELSLVEKAKTPSIDRAADPFARLLAACAPAWEDEGVRRILQELLYHVGRWIYLIDACADLADDWKTGSYNPVALRYELASPSLETVKEPLERTLERSLASIHAAFQLLDIRRDREILENIICLGLPVVTRQVLDGTYQSNGGQGRHGSL